MKNSEKFSKKRINTVFTIGACLSAFLGVLAAYFSIDYYGPILAALALVSISTVGVLGFYAFRVIMNMQRLTLEHLRGDDSSQNESYDEEYDIRRYYS